MTVLGIWDGHDAGAALLVDGRLVAAANEERFTRRKLEIDFPSRSIQACLELGGLPASAIDTVAASTFDVAKTLGRLVPSTREAYYQVRRRLAPPGVWADARRVAKYRMTEWRPTWWSRRLSERLLRRRMSRAGLGRARVRLYDHHDCHAATAAYGSGLDSCLVITIDGLGDGCAATVSRFADGRFIPLARTPAQDSPGVFFEHVTALLNMRELEDEGKVMALADYAAPVPDERNPLLSYLDVDGLRFRTKVPGHAMRERLRRELWFVPNEQFAFMAQRAIDLACTALVRNAVLATGEGRVALAGGVASNVKANRSIRLLPEVEDVFVYPHMGDGGLAVGAALLAEAEAGGRPALDLSDLGLGPEYDEARIEQSLRASGVTWSRPDDLTGKVADLLVDGRIVLWFQGRMEVRTARAGAPQRVGPTGSPGAPRPAEPRPEAARVVPAILPDALRGRGTLRLRRLDRRTEPPHDDGLLGEGGLSSAALGGAERGRLVPAADPA